MHKVAWLFDHVIICSLVTNKKRYLQYHKSYGHQIWQGSGLKAINLSNESVSLIYKPVNWFAQQINWLVSIWGQHWHLMS